MVKAALSTLAPNRPESKNCCFVKVLDSSFLEALVLNTVEKMHKWKLRVNFYTDVRNTKLFYNKEVYGLNIPQNAGNTGRAVIWRNASPSDNYVTMIGDYNNQINTELKLLNGEVWLIRTNADKTKTEKLIAKL